MKDPWENRNKGMQCHTCIWFVFKTKITANEKEDEKLVGRCRKHAPTMGGYPVVYGNDWCGDHRLDENKI